VVHEKALDFALIRLCASLRLVADLACLFWHWVRSRGKIFGDVLKAACRHGENARRTSEEDIELRFYIRTLIDSLDLDDRIWLLDELTREPATPCRVDIGQNRS
jgi:hypothetical protein